MSTAKETWPRVRLGDVCEIRAGQSPEGRYYTTDSSFTEFHQGSKNFGSWELLPSGVYTEKTTKIVEPGTLLISVRAPVGDLNITPRQICIGRGLAGLLPGVSLDRDFLCYFLTAVTKSINDAAGAGSCFSSISMKQLSRLILPLPPLATQREIVARLEKELGQVDELAKKFAELETTAEAEFKATLAEEMERLTHAATVPDVADIPGRPSPATRKGGDGTSRTNGTTGTRMVKLGEVCEIKNGYTPPAISLKASGEVPYFRISAMNLEGNEEFLKKATAYCDNTKKRIFKKDSIVFPKNGGAVFTRKVRRLSYDSIVDLNTGVLSPSNHIESDFLVYWFVSFDLHSCIVNGTIPFVDFNLLSRASLPLPPLPTQREIVARLDAAKARKEALVDAAKRGLAEAAQMRKAILKEAFE